MKQQPFIPNQEPEEPEAQTSSPEEDGRKALSRKRIFWTIVIFDIVVAVILVYEIVSLFILE
jgi:type IV secretory pathway component VirB8